MIQVDDNLKPNDGLRKKFHLQRFGTPEQIEAHKKERPDLYEVDPIIAEKQKKYWEGVFAEKEKKSITVKRAWKIFQSESNLYDSGFNSEINYDHAELLMWYIFRDERFLESKLVLNRPSFDKSIMLVGSVGTGKTMLLHAMSKIRNVPNPISGRMISENFIVNEKDVSPYFIHNLIIDDLGTNDDIESFNGKDKVEKMKLLLEQRYFLFKKSKKKTHLSTNKLIKSSGDEVTIDALYGERVPDRIREMCNVIVLTGKSLRK